MLPNLLARRSTNPTSDAVEPEMTKIYNQARRAIGVPNGIGCVPFSFPNDCEMRIEIRPTAGNFLGYKLMLR